MKEAAKAATGNKRQAAARVLLSCRCRSGESRLVCRVHALSEKRRHVRSTTRPYELGDDVYLILTLLDDPTRIPVAGKVVWISPAAGGNKTPGIGVHFPADETGMNARKRIEDALGGALVGSPTHTL